MTSMTTPPTEQAPDTLRTHFEALASDPSFKLRRSRRGTYVNPAVARDWKWFQLGANRAHQPAPGAPNSADELARDLKNAIDTATELREQLRLMEEQARNEVWRWQADGADELATMGNRMAVLIYASDLRDLIAAAPQPPAAAQTPVAYAAFADNGNIRLWSRNQIRHPDAQPLYVHPSLQPAETAIAGAVDALPDEKACVDYALQYGGHCRDCADENGVCPGSGLPCDGARKAVTHVVQALRSGLQHGYLRANHQGDHL